MDLREVGYDDRDWINVAQDRDRWRAYCEIRDCTIVPSRTRIGNGFGRRLCVNIRALERLPPQTRSGTYV
ncbi:hypothetical protein ANN_23007 [Periplaneta americana]|uniref:Uncharacterized protein n=1 Tax=Periplaneta americana TaxID=6978 RepID=A0ABQ8SLV5_PERAM|nr:hypothetical protein ANN_23007 [Periplaneta americana]